MRLSLTLPLLSVLATGCTAGVATLQPATVRNAGEFEASAGLAVHVPVENTAKILKSAIDGVEAGYRNDPNYQPTQEDVEAVARHAIGTFFNPPSAQSELAARVGVGKKIDVGLRLSAGALHLQGKWQFLVGDGKGWDGALILGTFGQHVSRELAVSDLTFARFSTTRLGLDGTALFGKRFGDLGFFWGGPRYQFQRTAVGVEVLRGAGVDLAGGSHLFGAVVGGAIGYKYIYFMAELTGGYVYCRPDVLGQKIDVGGTLLVPAFGLLGRF